MKRIEAHDFVMYEGEMYEVVIVQDFCLMIQNCHHGLIVVKTEKVEKVG